MLPWGSLLYDNRSPRVFFVDRNSSSPNKPSLLFLLVNLLLRLLKGRLCWSQNPECKLLESRHCKETKNHYKVGHFQLAVHFEVRRVLNLYYSPSHSQVAAWNLTSPCLLSMHGGTFEENFVAANSNNDVCFLSLGFQDQLHQHPFDLWTKTTHAKHPTPVLKADSITRLWSALYLSKKQTSKHESM